MYKILQHHAVKAVSLFTSLLLITFAQQLQAKEPHQITHNALVLTAPFVFATPPAALTAGGYIKIENTGDKDEVLTGGTASFATTTEIHEMKMVDSIMKMRQLEQGLVIPAGETVELKPGGFHMMFMGLSEQLKAGEVVTGTLEFKDSGPLQIEYQVLDRKEHMSGKKHKHGNH